MPSRSSTRECSSKFIQNTRQTQLDLGEYGQGKIIVNSGRLKNNGDIWERVPLHHFCRGRCLERVHDRKRRFHFGKHNVGNGRRFSVCAACVHPSVDCICEEDQKTPRRINKGAYLVSDSACSGVSRHCSRTTIRVTMDAPTWAVCGSPYPGHSLRTTPRWPGPDGSKTGVSDLPKASAEVEEQAAWADIAWSRSWALVLT
ncbi:hypothetical protein PLICRDRAFT_645421 [Plicaturopsis crispa FD-325 SS-3]|nr:hypothetical protein PLICRDRAFT_645421 [Plicaturopsis crispa FD-325 SS-3]